MSLKDEEHMIVFTNCGHIDCYKPVTEFFNFHDNKYNIVRKSIYQRKYHLDKEIFNLTKKYAYV